MTNDDRASVAACVAGLADDSAFAPDFDALVDRSGTASAKWEKYAGRDVLPFWVADMDLPTPPFVVDALRERLLHPVFGYTETPIAAVDAFLGWLARRYGWQASPEWLVWISGVVPGFTLAAQMLADQGDELVIPTPVYPPFLKVPPRCRLKGSLSPLVRSGSRRWEMDFDDLARRLGRRCAALMFCNPHNPTGRVYDEDELRRLAELVVGNDVVIVSDEIHCPLILATEKRHRPIAALDDEVAQRSITLFAPTKAYNFPGLGGAVAVIPDAGLRERFDQTVQGLAHGVSPLAYAALAAAFADQSGWLDALNAYLAANDARLQRAVAELPGISTTRVEGTYLAWLDARELGVPNPADGFEAFGLGLSDGAEFGAPGFARFNFGCPRAMLERGIERLARAVASFDG